MHSDRRRGKFIFQTISRLIMMALVIGVLPALAQNKTPAQNATPATARQAATMPAFASRLASCAAPQAAQRATRKHPAPSCGMGPGSPQDNRILYENGPVNGQVDAWTFNFGFAVTNTVQTNTQMTALNFWAWLIPGDTISNMQVSIGSSAFGSDLFNGVVIITSQSNCFMNSFGYNVCMQSGSITNGPTLNGNVWITLQNANVPSGDPVYWDENSGLGCTSPGCPSQAQENTIGTIPSEAFSILGMSTTSTTTTTTYPQSYCVPEQSGPFKVIHDFTGNGDGGGPSGVAIDGSGNLYGATQRGGSGAGTVYKLAQTASSWLLNTLYTFLGGSSGSSAQGVIVGPHDNLYGAALGGLQDCGWNGSYCGFIFQLRPTPNACPASSCSWTETVPYSFTGSTDAWNGGNLVSDQAGNLYGVSESGGAQQQGAVFELTPTLGGWAESLLYNFTGASDGALPTTLIAGNDGNLYGMTEAGGAYGRGAIFQLTPSEGGWNEVVVYSLANDSNRGSNLHSLQQDSAGNLFGIYEISGVYGNRLGVIFELAPSNGNWVFTQLFGASPHDASNDVFPNMILDAAGSLRVTEISTPLCPGGMDYAGVFELKRVNGWQVSTLVGWGYTYWDPGGSLALDAQGNLYGTDAECGLYRQGTVWELTSSP